MMTIALRSRRLSEDELKSGVDALPKVLEPLCQVDSITAQYGFGCRFPVGVDYRWEPIRLTLLSLQFFLEESQKQGIYVAGDGDLHIELPASKFWLHLISESERDVQSFLSSEPYSQFEFTDEAISPERIANFWLSGATVCSYSLRMHQSSQAWIGYVRQVPGVNSQGSTKSELLDNLVSALKESIEFDQQN
jgi:hypothetical protein